MAFATGGRMKREIFDDPYTLDDWDLEHSSRCFVNICNSLVWQAITGKQPGHPPPTAEMYSGYGLPWFDYYDDNATAVDGSAGGRDLDGHGGVVLAGDLGALAAPGGAADLFGDVRHEFADGDP